MPARDRRLIGGLQRNRRPGGNQMSAASVLAVSKDIEGGRHAITFQHHPLCRRADVGSSAPGFGVGGGVRYVRTTFLPGDETVLHVFEAASAAAVARAARRAALEYERIVEAVDSAKEDER